MIFATHQPNYLPWLGYFYKVMHSDVFVFLDDVQFANRSYQSRVQIKTANGAIWMTQPVLSKGRPLTNQVEFEPTTRWREKHIKMLALNYAKTPYFKRFHDDLTTLLLESKGNQSEVNMQLICGLAKMLGAKSQFVKSSEFGITVSAGQRIGEIGRHLGASVYLSGRGAMAYQKEEDFTSRGLSLAYTEFAPTAYSQLHGEFVAGLSIVDAIFNVGVDGVREILAASDIPKSKSLVYGGK